jgi:integrase
VPGFVLVHTPAGYSSYALRYRVNGKSVKLTLGSTKMLTLSEARKLAGKHRSEIETGADPHGAKVAQRRATVERVKLDPEYLWSKYMQLAASQLRSRNEKNRLFRRHILPVIGGTCITDVKRSHALEVVDSIVAEGKLRLADKVRQEGAAFFNWLLEREHVDRNVFAGIRKASIGKTIRTRVLTDDEIREIWIASEKEGRWGHWIKLLILTGTRNAEVREASWAEFDLQAKVWTIPAHRAKNNSPHRVFLTDAMLAVLDQVARFPNTDLLFPANGNPGRSMSGDQKVKDRIDSRMRQARVASGCREPENWRIHDFRRTIATGLQRLGFRPDIADQVIGHVSSTRTGAAAHYLHHRYEEEKQHALEAWSEHVTSFILQTQKSPTNIVALRA